MKKKYGRIVLYLAIALMIALGIPYAAAAADGEPALRFDLTTDDPVSNLSPGDQIKVNVTISREDGAAEEFRLYSVMLDLDYDKELFDVSQLKTSGLKRPDGQNWTGRWTCNKILDNKRIRVLYVNIGGLMSSPPVLDTVSGSFNAASFVLTVKDPKGADSSAITFGFTENGGPNAQKGPSVVGDELSLTFAGADSGSSDSGGGSGGSTGGNNGSGGSDSGSNSSTGGNSGGSGAGSGGSSGSAGSNAGSGAGQEPQDNSTGGAGTGSVITFDDLKDIDESHWAAGYVRYLVERGIVSGNEEKEFQPDKPVTRAEFAQMISSAFGYGSKTAAARFQDVTETDWYFRPVMALYQSGIVSGMDENHFGAEETLTRQDMAVILYKVMLDQNMTLPAVREYGDFRDDAQIADYARRALWEMVCTGIMSGTEQNVLAPEESTTRAQVATVLTNILQNQMN